ncbi:unnamed protein product [Microthlaspi erraticum]|uniref:Zinc knuckle CX2CX4HX4C domain-containing protein n=1 Tax=Microthlaspi erraticum TaxID=1685480 RepID=A0A6D2HYJ8_9BRAS|nr:unnamed protein product [Microthlaspi erraticum]
MGRLLWLSDGVGEENSEAGFGSGFRVGGGFPDERNTRFASFIFLGTLVSWLLEGLFWIQFRGIPLHYWKKELLNDIGKELGDYKLQLLTNLTAKIKVEINGLLPLTKDAIIEFEGGQEALVTFEYENLGKHCSYCYSLNHEVESCLEKPSPRPAKESLPRSTERDRFPTSTNEQPAEQRPFNLRKDRHGRPFGDRPSTKRTESARNNDLGQPRNPNVEPQQERRQPPNPPTPYKGNHVDPSFRQSRYEKEPMGTVPDLRHIGTTRRPNRWTTPPRQIWREKPPSLVDQADDISTTLLPIQITGRNLEIEAFASPQRALSEAEIMSSLQEVTMQYANVADPIERAARLQRVHMGEQNITLPREEVEERTDNHRPTQDQDPPRRPRGRPPTKKPTLNIKNPEAGTSKRKVKQGRISPFLRISPLSRIIQTRTSPVTHNHGTRRSRITLQRGSSGPSTPASLPPPTNIIPATRKATRKEKADFHNPLDPLP